MAEDKDNPVEYADARGAAFSAPSFLAAGGTGEIYEVTDETLGRRVAVKQLRDEFRTDDYQRERLRQEARVTAQLEHPNIVPIYGLGEDAEHGVFFTMKRLHGDSLRFILDQLAVGNAEYVQEYTRSVLLGVFLKICHGVSYAHSRGIIHRDLKPENIFIGNYGEVTIIDWGLVSGMSRKKANEAVAVDLVQKEGEVPMKESHEKRVHLEANNTMSGMIKGTPRYMSPEQVLRGSHPIDERTDIYSLGVIFYELISYLNPFGLLESEGDILNAVIRGTYTPLERAARRQAIEPELGVICRKMMKLNPDDRYRSVREVIKDIVSYMDGKPIAGYKAPLLLRMKRYVNRNPIRFAVMFGAFLSCFMMYALLFSYEMWMAYNTVVVASKSITALETRLRRLETTARMRENSSRQELSDARIRLDAIDNEIMKINDSLSSVSGLVMRGAPRIRAEREQMLMLRIQFSLNHGDLADLYRVRGLVDTMRRTHRLVFSFQMGQLFSQLERAIAARREMEGI